MGSSVVATETAAGDQLLHICLLGDLELRRGAAPLPLPPSRRTRALLGFLVASAARQSRAALCDLLWDGSDDPRAALRWSLTKLRAVVDDTSVRRLVADREHVSFLALTCHIDTERVRQLTAGDLAAAPLDALEKAAALLQREFLDGLELQDCFRFHHWCMAERERYGALRRSVLAALIERLHDEPERALAHARTMVAVDPLAEAPHATLVRLLAACGRYPEAERHYDWARALLRREVAIPRGGPLDEAIQRVRRERLAAGSAAAGSSSPAPPERTRTGPVTEPANESAPAALVGRALERAAIADVIVGHVRPRLLLFTGEPGIGKTRLLDHFAHSAQAAGRRVIRGRCFEAEAVRPYGLWLDTLREAPSEGMASETLERAAPLLRGQAGGGSSREQLFDAAVALIGGLAALQPLALVFDDLQWIDETSAALLHFLSRIVDTASVLLAGAARAGEVDDNRAAGSLLQSLQREGGLQMLELGPLSEAEARLLLDGAALDPVDALRQSGGNPLYLIELARAARRGADGNGHSVEALIAQRLHALEPAHRELLTWAAAMGRELRVELLATIAGMPLPQVLTGLERMERRGLIASCGDGSHFDFTHDLVRQTAYRTLSQPRRRTVHRQIAQMLIAASVQDPALQGEVVRHAALAGDHLWTARACLAAGEHCLRLFANAQAFEVADRGLTHVDELAAGAERTRLEIGLLRLRMAAAAGPAGRQGLPEWIRRIERAIAAAEVLALHAEAAAGWEILAFARQQSSDIARTQEATLAAQRATRRADAVTHCQQLANSGRCLVEIEADLLRGRALLDEAMHLADELELKVMELEWGYGLLARAEGDLAGACGALTRAVALAHAVDNHWRAYECMVWLATAEFERGRLDEVERLVAEVMLAATRMGETRVPFAQALAALVRLQRGERDAEVTLLNNVEALRALDDKAHLAYVLNEAASLALAAGRTEEAMKCADEALLAAQAVRRSSEIAVAMAHRAVAERDPHRATQALEQMPPDTAIHARAQAALQGAWRAISTLASTAAS